MPRDFAERTLRNIWPDRGSLRLDVRRPDHLAPLLGVVGDELAEVGGRARQRRASEVSQLRLDFGIGEACIDLLVEPVDDFGRRIPRCADAPKALAS